MVPSGAVAPVEPPTLPFWREKQTLRHAQFHWYPPLLAPLQFKKSFSPEVADDLPFRLAAWLNFSEEKNFAIEEGARFLPLP